MFRRREGFFERLPYWFLVLILGVIIFFWHIFNSETYSDILFSVANGIWITLYVSVISYIIAGGLGMAVCLMRISRNVILKNVATLYIEVVRGLPMLVVLYYIAFVAAPGFVWIYNQLISPLISLGIAEELNTRDFNFTARAVFALSIGYSAFLAEIFRAGIESLEVGQIEAARGLGMRRIHIFSFVVFPQAFKNILPAVGNEFIAVLKDSALVSVLGVQDITQLGKIYSSSAFLFFETYNVVALLYLSMTVTLSLLVRLAERHYKKYMELTGQKS